MAIFQKATGYSPISGLKPAMVQAPVFVSVFIGIRYVCACVFERWLQVRCSLGILIAISQFRKVTTHQPTGDSCLGFNILGQRSSELTVKYLWPRALPSQSTVSLPESFGARFGSSGWLLMGANATLTIGL